MAMKLRSILPQWRCNRSQITLLVLFLGSLLIYLANDRLLLSGDSLPTSIWLFNLLEHQRLTFDYLQHTDLFQTGIHYYFTQSVHGDWVTIYPIGTAILTAPIYCIFYLIYKISHLGAPLNLLSPEFELQRRSYERLAAALLAATSLVIFFQVLRFRFRPKIALITTIIFGFATTTWSVSAQALWQHGPLNLCVLASLWLVLRSEKSNNVRRDCCFAGMACGLLVGIRPTAIVYVVPIIIYLLYKRPKQLVYLGLGALSCVPVLAWNFYHFQHPFGGYSTLSGFHKLEYFAASFPGLLFSPSRGFFVYTPVMLFVLPGLWHWFSCWRRHLARSIDYLWLGLFAASLPIFVSYWFVICWWGGGSYGPRFYTDILPAWCVMLAYCLEWLNQGFSQGVSQGGKITASRFWITALFILTMGFSMFTQAMGVALPKAARDWNITPYSIDFQPNLAWKWSDPQFWRNFRTLQHRHYPKYLTSSAYLEQFAGTIQSLNNESGQLITENTPLIVRVTPTRLNYVILKPQLQNQGTQSWFGYDYSSSSGMPYVRCRLYDQTNHQLAETQLFIAGKIAPKAMAEAVGALQISPDLLDEIRASSGQTTYRLQLELIPYGLTEPIADRLDRTVQFSPTWQRDTF